MAMKVRVESIEREVEAMIRGDLSPQAAAKAFAAIARAERDEALKINLRATGRMTDYVTTVNGSQGASEDTVTLPGTIVYEFDIATNILKEVLTLLHYYSPRLTGRYQKSMAVYVDGIEVEEARLADLNYEEVVIVSTVAYARKIERGHSKQTPNGVFQVVAVMASRTYSSVATIKFSYRSPLNAGGTHLEAWASRTKQTRKRFKGGNKGEFDRGEWNRRQPAIVIRMK